MVYQISVFLENRAGQFAEITGILAENSIDLRAISIAETADYGVLRMIVDDAQNLTPHEMKTILTRAGEGTKVVVTGDPYQIDTPYLDVESNGLTYLVDRLKGQPNYGHITFTKTERSRLADQASRLL